MAQEAGIDLENITLNEGDITLHHDGRTSKARLRVAGDALILDRSGAESKVLVAPAPSESWSLKDVRVSAEGLEVDLEVDAQTLAREARP